MMKIAPGAILFPRLILSLGKLYTRDLRGRCGTDIDTAFGFISASSHGAAESAIMFADRGQDEGVEQGEEI